MTARIGVTGATGAVGGGVARGLAKAGIATRLIVRSAAKAPELPGTEVAVGDRAMVAAEQARRALERGMSLAPHGVGDQRTDALDQRLVGPDGHIGTDGDIGPNGGRGAGNTDGPLRAVHRGQQFR